MLLFLGWCTTKYNTPWDSPAASCPSVRARGQSASVKLERFASVLRAESTLSTARGPILPLSTELVPVRQSNFIKRHFCPVGAPTSRKVMKSTIQNILNFYSGIRGVGIAQVRQIWEEWLITNAKKQKFPIWKTPGLEHASHLSSRLWPVPSTGEAGGTGPGGLSFVCQDISLTPNCPAPIAT